MQCLVRLCRAFQLGLLRRRDRSWLGEREKVEQAEPLVEGGLSVAATVRRVRCRSVTWVRGRQVGTRKRWETDFAIFPKTQNRKHNDDVGAKVIGQAGAAVLSQTAARVRTAYLMTGSRPTPGDTPASQPGDKNIHSKNGKNLPPRS